MAERGLASSFISSFITLLCIPTGAADLPHLIGINGHETFPPGLWQLYLAHHPNFQLRGLGILGTTVFGIKDWGEEGTSALFLFPDTELHSSSSKGWKALLSPAFAVNVFKEIFLVLFECSGQIKFRFSFGPFNFLPSQPHKIPAVLLSCLHSFQGDTLYFFFPLVPAKVLC